MFYRLIGILILSLSFSNAADKLDPRYEIPPHVQFILRVYQAIEKEDQSLINPEAFGRVDLHYSLTLFFDPNWADKAIPTTLKGLDDHYGKIRKILVYPYWAHKKCLEVLEECDPRSYLTKENILYNVPVLLHDPILKEQASHEKMYPILLSLRSVKERKTPWQPLIREDLPLDIALPTEIENPLFLMALARSLQYFPSTMLELMNEYQSGKVEREQFAHIFKAKMMPDEYFGERPDNLLQFQYILWYIDHYDVFGEKAP